MEFEYRDDDYWHLVRARCDCGDTVHDQLSVDPDEGFARDGDKLRLHVPRADDQPVCETCQEIVAVRYTKASTPIEHWKLATTYRNIEWGEYDGSIDSCGWCRSEVDTLVHDTGTDTLVCEICAVLYNSTATDVDDSVALTDYVELTEVVDPIVVIDNGANQQSAAKIDRRPYISLKTKQKYVTVSIKLQYVDYQFSEEAISLLRDVFQTYEDRARSQSDNKGGVEFEVRESSSFQNRRPRQEIAVDGLFEADARDFIEEVIPIVSTTSNWTYDPADVSRQAMRQAIWARGRPGPAPVPREDAPDVVVQEDGLARHAPLSDKSITDAQIRAYVSDQAYRHGEALFDAGRIRTNHGDPQEGDVDGYDAESGVGFTLWFEDGEIVDHECYCESSLDPCEHIAGALLALPYVASYSGSEAKAHPFTGVDEADNWKPFHVRSHGWGWILA